MIYDADFDRELRRVVNEAVVCLNAEDTLNARDGVSAAMKLLSSRAEPMKGSETILSTLSQIARSLDERDFCIRLDEMLTAMMGEGMIEYDYDSRTALLDVMPKIIAQSEACVDKAEKQSLRQIISELISARQWHLDEHEQVEKLCQISVAHGFEQLTSSLHELLGNLRAQKAKCDLFDVEDSASYWPCIDYPIAVTVETFMKCNARCNFCPYPMMEDQGLRVGQRMSKSLFRKIINDLKDIPPELGFTLNLSRVNEPLLDSRIYDFLKIIDEELPGCHVWLPSNGSTLTEKNIRRLSDINCFSSLGISINSNDPEEYERIMGIPFERTKKNVDRLHVMLVAGEINFKVRLTHVTAPGAKRKEITAWIKERWPAFETVSYTPTDWLGITSNETPGQAAPVTPCTDWYQVHILADGSEALCCFDALGKYAAGNATDQHILEMYNIAWQRKARKYLVARQSEVVPEICHGCAIR